MKKEKGKKPSGKDKGKADKDDGKGQKSADQTAVKSEGDRISISMQKPDRREKEREE